MGTSPNSERKVLELGRFELPPRQCGVRSASRAPTRFIEAKDCIVGTVTLLSFPGSTNPLQLYTATSLLWRQSPSLCREWLRRGRTEHEACPTRTGTGRQRQESLYDTCILGYESLLNKLRQASYTKNTAALDGNARIIVGPSPCAKNRHPSSWYPLRAMYDIFIWLRGVSSGSVWTMVLITSGSTRE